MNPTGLLVLNHALGLNPTGLLVLNHALGLNPTGLLVLNHALGLNPTGLLVLNHALGLNPTGLLVLNHALGLKTLPAYKSAVIICDCPAMGRNIKSNREDIASYLENEEINSESFLKNAKIFCLVHVSLSLGELTKELGYGPLTLAVPSSLASSPKGKETFK